MGEGDDLLWEEELVSMLFGLGTYHHLLKHHSGRICHWCVLEKKKEGRTTILVPFFISYLLFCLCDL